MSSLANQIAVVTGAGRGIGRAIALKFAAEGADVVCLSCRTTTSRAALQQRLVEVNPGWAERHASAAVRPDGDVDLDDTAAFVVPDCDGCGGVLKPAVVFFGESVPKHKVDYAMSRVDEADALLVVGDGDGVDERVGVEVVGPALRPAFVAVAALEDPRGERRSAHALRPRYFSGSRSNFCLQPTAQK